MIPATFAPTVMRDAANNGAELALDQIARYRASREKYGPPLTDDDRAELATLAARIGKGRT